MAGNRRTGTTTRPSDNEPVQTAVGIPLPSRIEILIGGTRQSAVRLSRAKRMFGGLRLAPSVRIALERRCGGACESCGLEWRSALYVFRVDTNGGCNVANLFVLCGTCSADRID